MKAFFRASLSTLTTTPYCFLLLSFFLTVPARSAVVMIDNHGPVMLSLNPEGTLASADLDHPVDLPSAIVLGPDPAICFFWRSENNSISVSEDPFSKENYPAEWVSIPFSYKKAMDQRFPGAERLYCYDASRENANYNVFTLFMESATGETQLIRLKGRDNEEFVALDLSNYCANECINTRFALLHISRLRPKRKKRPNFALGTDRLVVDKDHDKDDEDEDANFAACYLMSRDRRSFPFQYSVTLSNLIDGAPQKSMFKSERPLPRTDRIVCFKDYRVSPAVQRYLEEFLV